MSRSILLLVVFAFLVNPLGLLAQSISIDSLLNKIYSERDYPGIVFSVAGPDNLVKSYTKGWADIENRVEMNEGSRLLSGSTGKTFVAAIIMQLISEDKLSLDDHISTWFSAEDWFSYLPNHEDLTLKHLMQHQSGLERYVFSPEFAREVHEDPDRVWKPVELLEYVFHKEPLFSPGEKFAYSDTNYILVGMIIEKVEGQDYYSVLNKRILEPLQLGDIVPTNSRRIERLAQGYMGDEGILGFSGTLLESGVSQYNLQFEWTGGGLAFPTMAYAKWLKLLFEGHAFDMQKVRPQYMQTVDSPEIGGKYGIGFQQLNLPDLGDGFGHSGFFPGYFTIGMYFPDHNIAVALQVNTTEQTKLSKFFPDFIMLSKAAAGL